MEHPENDDKYKGLKVNQGVSEMPTVNPYMTKGCAAANIPRRNMWKAS